MIHKFILDRCVQCNLPMAELEGAGWDCKGHAETPAGDEALWDLSSDYDPNFDAGSAPHAAPQHHLHGADAARGSFRPGLPKLPAADYAKPLPRVQIAEEEPPSTTDLCAIGSFATGVLGFWLYPVVLAPAALILSIISRQRIKDSRHLKGTGFQVIGGLLGIASVVYLLVGMGVFDKDRKAVDWYLSNTVAGHAPYEVWGVSNYEVVDYQIEKSSGGIVTAKITFKNGRGDDLVQTHNFRVNEQGQVQLFRSR